MPGASCPWELQVCRVVFAAVLSCIASGFKYVFKEWEVGNVPIPFATSVCPTVQSALLATVGAPLLQAFTAV